MRLLNEFDATAFEYEKTPSNGDLAGDLDAFLKLEARRESISEIREIRSRLGGAQKFSLSLNVRLVKFVVAATVVGAAAADNDGAPSVETSHVSKPWF